MKAHARLRLPPLATLNEHSLIQYALLARDGSIEERGELSLQQLANSRIRAIHCILHPEDAVVADLTLPPLNRKRLTQAVNASVEPMLLDSPESVIVAHSSQQRDTGHVQVAWIDRQLLLQAWERLLALGLPPKSIVPQALLTATSSDHDPTTALWLTNWPSWSLTNTALRPTQSSTRWHSTWLWLSGAALIWIVGLNLYAARLSTQMQNLSAHIETTVKSAFPEIPVLLDPLAQATKQLNLLRHQAAAPGADEFARLALAATQIPEFAQGRVQSIQYQPGLLRLEVLPQTNTLDNRYAAKGMHIVGNISIEKDPQATHVWFIRPRPQTPQEARQ